MPCYPALALLLGQAVVSEHRWLQAGTKTIAAVTALAMVAILAILWLVRGLATPGDIASALNSNPEVYTLSLGHMTDLTIASFAYLRAPLCVAAAALAIGSLGAWASRKKIPVPALTVMMVLFFHAARLALVVFDPYLSSRPLADALLREPPGTLIVDDQYYTFSSVFFYANSRALLLNGRVNNLEYGSYAPNAPQGVFIDDRGFQRLWRAPELYYLVAENPQLPRFAKLVDKSSLHVKKMSGGKFLIANH